MKTSLNRPLILAKFLRAAAQDIRGLGTAPHAQPNRDRYFTALETIDAAAEDLEEAALGSSGGGDDGDAMPFRQALAIARACELHVQHHLAEQFRGDSANRYDYIRALAGLLAAYLELVDAVRTARAKYEAAKRVAHVALVEDANRATARMYDLVDRAELRAPDPAEVSRG